MARFHSPGVPRVLVLARSSRIRWCPAPQKLVNANAVTPCGAYPLVPQSLTLTTVGLSPTSHVVRFPAPRGSGQQIAGGPIASAENFYTCVTSVTINNLAQGYYSLVLNSTQAPPGLSGDSITSSHRISLRPTDGDSTRRTRKVSCPGYRRTSARRRPRSRLSRPRSSSARERRLPTSRQTRCARPDPRGELTPGCWR
jgi:hypothetical protein